MISLSLDFPKEFFKGDTNEAELIFRSHTSSGTIGDSLETQEDNI
jgi:hypothetical protein